MKGEMDWKVIAIAADDPLASSINNVDDLEQQMPGKVKSILDWFKFYKMPDGKPENVFGFDDKAMDVEFTQNIVEMTHEAWKNKDKLAQHGLWTK